MPDSKEFKTYDEQLDILTKRGLIVSDREKALRWLKDKNYYRLSAYSLTLRFKDSNSGEESFYPGATFENIVELYFFDESLRREILLACARIETRLKAAVAYRHTQLYGPVQYLDSGTFEDPWLHAKMVVALSRDIGQRKDEPFVLHHQKELNGIYPLWVIVETCTFDQISMMYHNLKLADRAYIAKETYGVSSREYIENWVHCAVVARNIAAHGARFYNRARVNPPAKLPQPLKQYATKPFGYFYAISHLLQSDEKEAFVISLRKVFEQYPFADPLRLGCPPDWDKILLQK